MSSQTRYGCSQIFSEHPQPLTYRTDTKVRNIRKATEPAGQQIKIRNVSQLIESSKVCLGLSEVNDLIGMMDSIGFSDLMNVKALFNSGLGRQSKEFIAAVFCNMFLRICLPVEKQMEHVVWTHHRKSGRPDWGECIYEEWNFSFLNGEATRQISRSTRTPTM